MVVGFALPSAQAADLENTTAFSPPTIFYPGLTVAIGNTFTDADTGLSFLDHYTFTLGGTGLAVGTAITITIDLASTLGHFELDPFNAGLFTGAGDLVGMASAVDNGSQRTLTGVFLPLAAGDYDFRVGGLVAGADGGSYGGTLQVTTPVPEPEIYAMMAAGLGIMGWIGRRRKQQVV